MTTRSQRYDTDYHRLSQTQTVKLPERYYCSGERALPSYGYKAPTACRAPSAPISHNSPLAAPAPELEGARAAALPDHVLGRLDV